MSNTLSAVAAADPVSHGSIITSTTGGFSHTFTSDATVSVAYIKGAGGDGPGEVDGDTVFLQIDSPLSVVAEALGGGWDGTEGTATNSIGGSNITGGGGSGVDGGGAGGAVIGGSFVVTSGQSISGSVSENGSVSISW